MRLDFHQKVVVISGSSRGIGKSLAELLLERGATVVINGINQARLAAAHRELQETSSNCEMIAGDVSDWKFCERLMSETVDRYGRIDYLVNNAAIATRGSVEAVAPEVFVKVANSNVLGSIFPTKAALPYLRRSRGYVLFVSSIASFYGLPYNAIYCATKRSLTGFEQAIHHEVREFGVGSGIAYVGFVKNDPKKIIYDSDGSQVYLPRRQGVRLSSRPSVALTLARCMRKRRRRKTIGFQGKSLMIVSRLAPRIIDLLVSGNRARIQAQSEGHAELAKE